MADPTKEHSDHTLYLEWTKEGNTVQWNGRENLQSEERNVVWFRKSNISERCINNEENESWNIKKGKKPVGITIKCKNENEFWSTNVTYPKQINPPTPPKNSKLCDGAKQFACDNWEQCIPREYICDGIYDCSDYSDECPKHAVIDILEDMVTFQKIIYVDNKKLKIKLSIDANEKITKEHERRTGRVLGLYGQLKTDLSNEKLSFTCINGNCSVMFLGFKFREDFRVWIFPITRAVFEKYGKLESMAGVKDNIHFFKRIKTESFDCYKNKSLIHLEKGKLCDSKDDCDPDEDGVALDEKPEICRGNISLHINLAYFGVFGTVLLLSLLFFQCWHSPCHESSKETKKETECAKENMITSLNGVQYNPKLLNEFHEKNMNSYFNIFSYLLKACKTSEEKCCVIGRINSIEEGAHESTEDIYACFKNKDSVDGNLFSNLIQYRKGPSSCCSCSKCCNASEEEETNDFDYILGCMEKMQNAIPELSAMVSLSLTRKEIHPQ